MKDFLPHLWSLHPHEACVNNALIAGNHKNVGWKKSGLFQPKVCTDLHAIVDSGCLVILTILHIYYWSVYSWKKVVPDGPALT